MPVNTPNMTRF